MELDEHQPTMIEADEAKTTVTGAVSGAPEDITLDPPVDESAPQPVGS